MPELPEVEHGRRIAEQHLVGKQIAKVATVNDDIVYDGVPPRRFAAALKGRTVIAACRWGKHLWFELDERPWPTLHFGMTGRFDVYKDTKQRPTYWKVEVLTEDGQRLSMRNPRRLGRIRLRDNPRHEPPISELGFDPLLSMPSLRVFQSLLARRSGPVKGVLLDQSFAAGVGNWIADEVLYQAGIAPHRKADTLSVDDARRLRNKLTLVIRKAVEADAVKERFPRTWLFHHRWGKNSEAITHRRERIIHETIAGRTTAWVPSVQT